MPLLALSCAVFNPVIWARIFSLIAASLTGAVFVALFFYSFQMSKFLLPAVPFLCVLAARGIALLVRACRGPGVLPVLTRAPAAALLALTAWGCAVPFAPAYFSRPGVRWSRGVAPFAQGHFSRPEFPWGWREGTELLDRIAPPDAVLISGIDGVFVTHYFVKGTRRSYVPVSRDVEYVRHRKLSIPVAAEDRKWLAAAAGEGRKVYMDGYTYLNWAGCRTALERDFAFVPVAAYREGALRIFELRPRAFSSPTS